jgi:hypothetical protein
MRGDNFLIQKQFIFTVTGQAGRWPLSPSPTEVWLNSQALKTRVLHVDKFGHSLDLPSVGDLVRIRGRATYPDNSAHFQSKQKWGPSL